MVAQKAGTSGPLRNRTADVIETSIVLECSGCRRVDDRTVTAYAEPGVAGLAVNRMHIHSADPKMEALAARSWVVSHLTGTGKGAVVLGAGYEHRGQAELALHLLGALDVDWRLPADDPRFRDPVLVAVLVDIVEQAQGLEMNLDLP